MLFSAEVTLPNKTLIISIFLFVSKSFESAPDRGDNNRLKLVDYGIYPATASESSWHIM
jgi:hypothetical protein